MPTTKPTHRKCPNCGESKPPGALLCADCWSRVPTALKRSFRAAGSYKERIGTANAIHRWFRRHERQIAAGISVDGQGRMHLDVPEFLAAHGLADNEHNRDMVLREAQKLFAQTWPQADQHVIVRDDLDPDG